MYPKREAKLLVLLGHAVIPVKAVTPKPPRQYRRRDMVAQHADYFVRRDGDET